MYNIITVHTRPEYYWFFFIYFSLLIILLFARARTHILERDVYTENRVCAKTMRSLYAHKTAAVAVVANDENARS